MSANGWRVADSDMHVMEPPDLWERYIAAEWRHAAPIGLSELHRDMRVRVKDHSLTRMGRAKPNFAETVGWKPGSDEALAPSESRLWDPASQLAAMDEEGVDVAVLFPSRGLFVLGLDSTEHVGADGLEPGLAAAIARAYNDWMADYCSASPRLLGAGLLAPHDVDAAVDEVRRCIETLGFKTVFMLPGPRQRAGVERSRVRPDLAHVRAARRAGVLPRRRSELPAARLHARVRQPHDVAHLRPAGRDHGRDREHHRRRGAPAVPEAARRSARRELRMGAVVARSPRRALGVGGRQGRPRARARAVGVLPLELLPEHRGRRASGARTTSTGSATTTSCSRPTTRTATRSSPRRWRRSWSCRIDEDTKRKVLWDNWCRLYGMPTET